MWNLGNFQLGTSLGGARVFSLKISVPESFIGLASLLRLLMKQLSYFLFMMVAVRVR